MEISIEELCNALSHIDFGYGCPEFNEDCNKVYVQDYHMFDSINEFFKALDIGEVEEVDDDEFMEETGMYTGIIKLTNGV